MNITVSNVLIVLFFVAFYGIGAAVCCHADPVNTTLYCVSCAMTCLVCIFSGLGISTNTVTVRQWIAFHLYCLEIAPQGKTAPSNLDFIMHFYIAEAMSSTNSALYYMGKQGYMFDDDFGWMAIPESMKHLKTVFI